MHAHTRAPNPVHFNTPLLITYLSAIKTVICHRDIEFYYFLRFRTNYNRPTRFSKHRIELIVALSSTNATKAVTGLIQAKLQVCQTDCIMFKTAFNITSQLS